MMHRTDTSEFAYLSEMIAHHQEAISTAGELARSGRSQMRAFGDGVVTSQSAQVRQMQAWLARWYPGQGTRQDYRPMMRDLTGLSGDDLDRTFLQDMIGHHMLAVMMSQHLVAGGVAEHQQVVELAATIRDEQHAEILQMRRWLADWFNEGTGWMGQGMGMGTGMGGWMSH